MNRATVQNLGLAAASIILCLIAIVAGSKLYTRQLRIRDPSFRYENKLNMWRPEPEVGFINKPNFSSFSFGNIPVETNARGLRDTKHGVATGKKGALKIIAIGDSVMWGTGVIEDDSIPGVLEKQLHNEGLYEVINASVVGYSTYQELLYLQKYVLPLQPSIVLVNYCENDFLPTEDPFKNVRQIHLRYLNAILESKDLAFSPEERADIQKLIQIFASAEHIWSTMDELEAKSPSLFNVAQKVFIEIPVARMTEVTRAAGVRLVYVFVPPRSNRTEYARFVDKLKKILVQRGAEFVDVQQVLVPEKRELTRERWMNVSRLGWVWPRELRQILILLSMRSVHGRDMYIDSLHPTKKGNALVAGHIYRYLKETSGPKRTEMAK